MTVPARFPQVDEAVHRYGRRWRIATLILLPRTVILVDEHGVQERIEPAEWGRAAWDPVGRFWWFPEEAA